MVSSPGIRKFISYSIIPIKLDDPLAQTTCGSLSLIRQTSWKEDAQPFLPVTGILPGGFFACQASTFYPKNKSWISTVQHPPLTIRTVYLQLFSFVSKFFCFHPPGCISFLVKNQCFLQQQNAINHSGQQKHNGPNRNGHSKTKNVAPSVVPYTAWTLAALVFHNSENPTTPGCKVCFF